MFGPFFVSEEGGNIFDFLANVQTFVGGSCNLVESACASLTFIFDRVSPGEPCQLRHFVLGCFAKDSLIE